MAKNKLAYDVFVAFDRGDATLASKVADAMRSRGLKVFVDTTELPSGTDVEGAIWQAMAESHALVVVLPEQVNLSWLAFELGAAKAWNKPIYAVSAYNSHQNIPVTLRGVEILPITRVDEIGKSIVGTFDPLSDEDITQLGKAYSLIGIPVDQLSLSPQQLMKLVALFNRTSGRQLSGEQVLSHLLRLRKQSKLPVLKKSK